MHSHHLLTLLLASTPLTLSQQITQPPSVSEYTTALHIDNIRRDPSNTHASLSSADALSYCQLSEPGCTNQLNIYSNCQSTYGTSDKYLYCLCTASYYMAISACDACSASLGALPWSQVSGDVAEAATDCGMWYSSYGTPGSEHSATTTKKGGATSTTTGGGKGGTATQGSAASGAGPSATQGETTTTVSIPTEPYAGLAGTPTIPGEAAASTSSGAAVGWGWKSEVVRDGVLFAGLIGLGVIV